MVEEEIDLIEIIRKMIEESNSKTVDLVIEHELRDVTPEMIDWWWDHIDNTQRYELWHPEDHVSFKWEVPPSRYGHVGAIQVAVEKIGGPPSIKLRIRWEEPSSAPIPTIYSHVLVASIIDHDDKPLIWFVHEYEAESYGTRMRSTFRFPARMPSPILDAMRKHNKEEMEQFSKFLPKLYKQSVS
ncbi:MAG: DAPG hydrolase family protein [Candidatus Jordarchaeum sp.]|uniref:DAPG hydrolase family protein n=1 Tax=Candidatus Jordarchaeum sp. TaxID=2823881 RepID=UPI00404B7332